MAQAWRGAPLTVSIGVAVLGEDGSDTDELIDSAEQAAGRGGRAGSVVHRRRAAERAACAGERARGELSGRAG